MSGFKLPSDPSLSKDYSLWRKDAIIWQKLTSVEAEKQGLALQYACQSDPRVHEAVVDVESEKVECADGFKNVLAVLDKFYKVDEKEAEYKAYHEFENISRSDDQSMADYINHFDTLWNKTKKHGNTISANLLAVKLIRGAMLTKTQQEVIQAAGLNMTYDVVKATMLRMFGESTGLNSTKIKTEPTFHQTKHLSNCSGGACNCNKLMGHHSSSESTSDEETYYGRNKRYWKKKDNRNYSKFISQQYEFIQSFISHDLNLISFSILTSFVAS